VNLGDVPDKGQKMECPSCNHVFRVQSKRAEIDRTLSALKDRVKGWDAKMASLEDDDFANEILHGDAPPRFAEASSEDLDLLLEESAMEERAPEREAGTMEISGMDESGLNDLADEISLDSSGGTGGTPDEVINNLFDEVESRDLLEEVQMGIFADEKGPREDQGLDSGPSDGESEMAGPDGGLEEITPRDTGAATEEITTGPAPEKYDQADRIPPSNAGSPDEILENVAEAESSPVDDMATAFDGVFGEDPGTAVADFAEQPTFPLSGLPEGPPGPEGESLISGKLRGQGAQAEEPRKREAPEGLDDLDAAMDALFEDEKTSPEPGLSEEQGAQSGLEDETAEGPSEDAETRIQQTPLAPGTVVPEMVEQGEAEEELSTEATAEPREPDESQTGLAAPGSELAPEGPEGATVEREGGQEEEAPLADVASSSIPEEQETVAVSAVAEEEETRISEGPLATEADGKREAQQAEGDSDQPLTEGAEPSHELSGTGEKEAQDTKPQGATEIIKQDELDNLWEDAIAEQLTPRGEGETEGEGDSQPVEMEEDLMNAALEEQSAGKGSEEKPAEPEAGEISQDEMGNLLSPQALSKPEESESTEELTSQTEVLAEGEEKPASAGEGGISATGEGAPESAEGEEDFEIDDELLEKKGPAKGKSFAGSLLKFLPGGKMRYVAVSALGLVVIGTLGGGGYYAYLRMTRFKMVSSPEAGRLTGEDRKGKDAGRKGNSERKSVQGPAAPNASSRKVSETNASVASPSRVPLSGKKTLELGLIMPIQFGPLKTKVLQADFIFEMKDHQSYQRLKFYLPIYQDLMENVTNKFFSQGFYNEIHYAKEKLKDKLMEKFNESMKDNAVINVRIKSFIIDIKKKKKGTIPKKPPEKKAGDKVKA